MRLARPIPIHGQGNNRRFAGSAFLVAGHNQIWMVTCIHNFTMMNPTPISFLDPSSSVSVIGTDIFIPNVFRRNYGWACIEGTSNLVDCTSIPLTAGESSALISFGVFNLADVAPPTLNQKVTFAGFPGIETDLIPSVSVSSFIDQIDGYLIAMKDPSIPGHSGGPLYSDSGLLGVMHGDIGVKPNYRSGLAINLHQMRRYLFG